MNSESIKGPITLVSGGPPCQPASVAGKRKGKKDDRWLWPETFRVIRELHPRWCLLENPPGILSLESGVVFEDLLLELESQGYTVWPFIIPAAGVGAPHLRYRVFIVAYSSIKRREREQVEPRSEIQAASKKYGKQGAMADTSIERKRGLHLRPGGSQQAAGDIKRGGQNCQVVADTEISSRNREKQGQQQGTIGGRSTQSGKAVSNTDDPRRETKRPTESIPAEYCPIERSDWWEVEPNVGRVAARIPFRVDRLKCLGNAVVPKQCWPILKAIADIERNNNENNKIE